jgi:hypothetical protein
LVAPVPTELSGRRLALGRIGHVNGLSSPLTGNNRRGSKHVANDVRFKLSSFLYRVLAVNRFSAHITMGFEKRSHATSNDFTVIDY